MKTKLQNYKKIKRFLLIIILLASNLLLMAQDVNSLAKDLKGKNIGEITTYLATRVDFTLLDKDCPACPRQKATARLSHFFRQNKVKDFKVKHKGMAPDGSSFLVGTLFTQNGRFRTYILLKNKKIQELSFER